MLLLNSSFYDLISSIQLCICSNREVGSCIYSKFNLKVISFLLNRGLLLNFNIIKTGYSGKIQFSLRRINGSMFLNSVSSPVNKSSNFLSKFSRYKSCQSLLKSFSSEFVVVSTSKGLMTANEALSLGLGGVIILIIK